MSGSDIAPEIGNALPLAKIPVGTVYTQRRNKPGAGVYLDAGSFVTIACPRGGMLRSKCLPGEMRQVFSRCIATAGAVSNPDHMNESVGKGRRSTLLENPVPRRSHEPCRSPDGCGEVLSVVTPAKDCSRRVERPAARKEDILIT